MASANRHWPSMFKSKPCNPNHQFPHDSLISTPIPGSNKTPYTSGGGCEEKGPEPKPRWNPKAEQIRILEGIFNSGMVNPPREEIRKIRIQLQEYGQVGDANVFYWFQNRKSRTKHKLRNLTKHHHNTAASNNNLPANSSSSSNSSDHKLSSPPKDLVMNISSANPNVINHNNKGFSSNVISTEVAGPNSPTASVNQTFFQPLNNNHLIPPPTTTPQPSADHESFFPTALYHNNHDGAAITTEAAGGQLGSYDDFVSELFQQQPNYPTNTAYAQQPACANMLLSEIMMTHHELASKNTKYLHDQDHQNQSQFISFSQPATTNNFVPSIITTTTTTPVTVPSPITAHHQFQGVGDANAATARSTVFINDVAFEVGVGPFNVREAFGDDALLIQSSGHPVLTDHWGLTLYPLQHGASYYLV